MRRKILRKIMILFQHENIGAHICMIPGVATGSDRKIKMAACVGQALTILLFFATNCAILADWNTKDYLKKENTLVKPYNGMISIVVMYENRFSIVL